MAHATEAPRPFWSSQWRGKPTWPQHLFDLLFGVLAPPLCVAFDPIVFQGPRKTELTVLAPVFIHVQSALLLVWLLLGPRLGSLSPLLAGLLGAGTVLSFFLGLAILPLSLLGLLFLIGIFGFTPFLTGFVFLRNAIRAWTRSPAHLGPASRTILLVSGSLLILGPLLGTPGLAAWEMEHLIAEPSRPPGAFERLGMLHADRIIPVYEGTEDPVRKKTLAALYSRLTGKDLQWEIQRLND